MVTSARCCWATVQDAHCRSLRIVPKWTFVLHQQEGKMTKRMIGEWRSLQRILAVMATAAITLGVAFTHASARADEPMHRLRIAEPGSKIFGKSYNEWTEEWSNWAFQFPAARSPILDPDGRFCDQGQRGKVWFLAGAFVGADPVVRTCRVPPGKALFFPIVSGLSFPPEFPEEGDPCLDLPEVIDQVRCDVSADIAPVISMSVTIDGVPVADPFAYRVPSSPGGFAFNIPEGSILTDLGFPAGVRFPAVADGYWLMVKPLGPGEHTIHIFAELEDGGVLDVTWIIA